ncbi:MAG: thiamine phosphate synthase [Nevskia sp.]|nr:thiamine phosphate synthase [Nevskia sp.]
MSAPLRLHGLYAITSDALCVDPARLLACVSAALRGGAALIQYRDKQGTPAQRAANARALAELCHEAGAKLIVNDDVALALGCGADGVHLGAADAPLSQARAALGPRAILGASCGPVLARAHAAVAGGADYVAFGRFFDSRTKPQAPPATVELMVEARRRLQVPICAIGGVTPANAGTLLEAGADLIAAVDGVFGCGEPAAVEAAARSYAALFTRPPGH